MARRHDGNGIWFGVRGASVQQADRTADNRFSQSSAALLAALLVNSVSVYCVMFKSCFEIVDSWKSRRL